jgi:hypothetical protein
MGTLPGGTVGEFAAGAGVSCAPQPASTRTMVISAASANRSAEARRIGATRPSGRRLPSRCLSKIAKLRVHHESLSVVPDGR